MTATIKDSDDDDSDIERGRGREGMMLNPPSNTERGRDPEASAACLGL